MTATHKMEMAEALPVRLKLNGAVHLETPTQQVSVQISVEMGSLLRLP